jgi:hypothetical protein
MCPQISPMAADSKFRNGNDRVLWRTKPQADLMGIQLHPTRLQPEKSASFCEICRLLLNESGLAQGRIGDFHRTGATR